MNENRKIRRGETYEVDIRGVGELLLSIGTFRRICEKDGQRGVPAHKWDGFEGSTRYKADLDGRRCSYIPGERVLCNTWRASMMSGRNATDGRCGGGKGKKKLEKERSQSLLIVKQST